jgi:hypothetical protein
MSRWQPLSESLGPDVRVLVGAAAALEAAHRAELGRAGAPLIAVYSPSSSVVTLPSLMYRARLSSWPYFGDGLDKAVQKAFTRPIPKSAGAQMRYLVKQLKGTKAVAQMLRVS